MNQLTSYSILEQLYSGDKIIVSRAIRNADKKIVVLKTLKAEYPDPHDIARLSYEYDLLKQLDIPEMVQAYTFEKQQNLFTLVLENVPNSMTLRSYLNTYKLDIVAFLRIAIQMATALDKIHEAGIIHKDINPDNILVIGEGEAIKILDLSLATQLQEEEVEIMNSALLEGTLPYISPEQTTRMNRPIDRRSDLYSLGITFYEMLLGHSPFHAKDAIGWVHCHIAKQPMAPHKLISSIPEMISAIILKLLAKSAEDRYATALGLQADLEKALILWQKNNNIPTFELGTKDRKGIFQIPQKLYGRETEIESLMNIFELVSHGNRELLLISGYTGIGKSSLIREVQKPIVKRHGYFASGKYENYNRDVPYAGLIQAFRNLINQILAENKHQVQQWRDKILDVIAPNGQVLVNVIPELEKLIGKQPSVIDLPPAESRIRFDMVFFDFVNIFAKKEHPLVLFIDDLQWANVESFNLISQLIKNPDLKYFLLLGAYRDNEVNQTHPLCLMLEKFNKDLVQYKEISLKPLSIDHLRQLISDTLHNSRDIQQLTNLIHEKTAGNPYFVNLFLTTLYKTQQLRFDPKNDWVFDIDAINNLAITDNVVDLVISEIGKLSPETQELLKISTCIGTDFDLKSLMELTGQSAEQLTSLLWPALKEKWIIQLGESYKHLTKNSYFSDQINIHYRFSHDNVKLTLYSLMPSETLEKIHYQFGKNLLKDYDKDTYEDNLFVIAQHFSACLPLIQDPKEKIQIAELLFHAANQMKRSISYETAIKHYKHALELLGTKIWQQHYNFAIEGNRNLATCYYLIGSLEQSIALFDDIFIKAQTPIDKARIMNDLALLYSTLPQYPEAIAACEEGLRILGVKIPKDPRKFLLLRTWLKIKWYLRNKKINDLLDLPLMKDPKRILIMELLGKLSNLSFIAMPGKFNKPAYATMLSVIYSIKYGNDITSSYSYALLGQFEIMHDNIDRAYQFCELGLKLCEKFDNKNNLPILYLLAITRILPWKLPYKEVLNHAIKGFELSYETGHLNSFQYIGIIIPTLMYMAGVPLIEVDNKISDLLNNPQCTCNNDISAFLNMFQYFVKIVRNERPVEDYDNFVEQFTVKSNINAPVIALIVPKIKELLLAYLFEDWPHAEKTIQQTENLLLKKPFNTVIAAPSYYMIYALTLLSIYHRAPFFKRMRYRRKLNKVLAKVKSWQTHCPSNYESTYYLIKAGIAEIHGKIDQALIDYEKSIASSREAGRVFIQAITHEYIARCYLKRNQPRSAIGYLKDAHDAYQQAGWCSKVTLLQKNHPELLDIAVTTSSSSQHHSTSILDIDTVLKSSQTISGQMKLEKLLATLIELVIENAGAERSVLLLMQNDKLMVEAEGKIATKPRVLQKQPIEAHENLALSVVQYVQNTHEPVVLSNATQNGAFTEDPYIIENKPLSILCTPILYKNYLFGILYLENNLARDAFTQKHLELLKVLSSQISISIENARLYNAYDQFIPHEFLDILGKHSIMDISLGDNVQREMSVLFTDIRGFSKLSEQMGAQEIFRFMNNYLGHMAPTIKNHGGFIDKYIGDAIMALFAGDATSAIAAGIDMQKELINFNQELISDGKQPIAIGIGINSGNLTLGTLGSLNRIETSVLSDAVNLAERIQELTKKYDCRLLISGSTYQKLAQPTCFDLRFIERTTVRGRDEIIDIWEVFNGDPDDLRHAKLAIAKHYNEAIECFLNQSYEKALILLQRCLVSLPNDKVILKYIMNCQKILSSVKIKH